MKTYTTAFTVLLCALVLPTQPVSAQVVAPPAPKQNVAPTLAMEILKVNGQMEAQFTNNTQNDVGVMLGKKILRLKPGKSGNLAVPKVENLKIYDFVQGENGMTPRLRASTMIAPQPGKGQFLKPK